MSTATAPRPYAVQGRDRVRALFECDWLARLLPLLLRASGGGALLDLGCGDGLAAAIAGSDLERYSGVDLLPPPGPGFVTHDLRDGLGPVGQAPFDLYLGSFSVASHLPPRDLRRLIAEIAVHARPGAVVALEALGLRSLEWPRLWGTRPGPARTIPYRLGDDVAVHPWAPGELAAVYEQASIRALRAFDRSLQAGPKTGEGRYWPGLPRLRGALNELLAERETARARAELSAPLPPLPAGEAALIHHTLAARRRDLAGRTGVGDSELAHAVWALEPLTGGGFGHGLMLVGRVL